MVVPVYILEGSNQTQQHNPKIPNKMGQCRCTQTSVNYNILLESATACKEQSSTYLQAIVHNLGELNASLKFVHLIIEHA